MQLSIYVLQNYIKSLLSNQALAGKQNRLPTNNQIAALTKMFSFFHRDDIDQKNYIR